jgi:hypothetical protein
LLLRSGERAGTRPPGSATNFVTGDKPMLGFVRREECVESFHPPIVLDLSVKRLIDPNADVGGMAARNCGMAQCQDVGINGRGESAFLAHMFILP